MRFYTFAVRKYKDSDSAKGTLARSMKSDGAMFPKTRIRYKTIKKFLQEECHASEKCITAFDEVWKEYKEHEGKRNRTGIGETGQKSRRHSSEVRVSRL